MMALLPLEVAGQPPFGVLNCVDQVLETREHLFDVTRETDLFYGEVRYWPRKHVLEID